MAQAPGRSGPRQCCGSEFNRLSARTQASYISAMPVARRMIWLLMLGLTPSCAPVVPRQATVVPDDVGSVAVDQQGNVYVAPDYSKLDANGHAVDHVHFPGSIVPQALAVDAEFLYCAIAKEK